MAHRERDILERADHTIAEEAAGTARPGVGFRRFINAMTFVVCLATVAIPYWVDRALRRWWEANRPIAPFGTRYRRMQTGYKARQDSLAEEAVIVGAIAGVIAASVPPPRRFSHVASSD